MRINLGNDSVAKEHVCLFEFDKKCKRHTFKNVIKVLSVTCEIILKRALFLKIIVLLSGFINIKPFW